MVWMDMRRTELSTRPIQGACSRKPLAPLLVACLSIVYYELMVPTCCWVILLKCCNWVEVGSGYFVLFFCFPFLYDVELNAATKSWGLWYELWVARFDFLQFCVVWARWLIQIMLSWRQQSFCISLFKSLKTSRQNWLQSFMWCVYISYVVCLPKFELLTCIKLYYSWLRFYNIWDPAGRRTQCPIK